MKKKPKATQLGLFDIDAARRNRDAGIDRATKHADSDAPSWSEVAYGFVELYAREHETFMTEDIRAHAHAVGFAKPPDGRAWGGPVMRASKRGLIRKVGYAPMKSKNCNANPKAVWTLASREQQAA